MHSSIRLPRCAHGTPIASKSSGQGDSPTPETEPVAGEEGDRRGLLGDQHRRPHGKLQHERGEAQRRGHRGQVRAQHHRLDELLVLEELPVAGVGVGVRRVRLARVDQAVGDGHAGVPGRLGRPGERCVERRLRHRLGVGESHVAQSFGGRAGVRWSSGPRWSSVLGGRACRDHTLERVPVICQSGRVDLQQISDRLEIEDVLIRYTRAIDTGDWERLDTRDPRRRRRRLPSPHGAHAGRLAQPGARRGARLEAGALMAGAPVVIRSPC